MGQDQCCAEVGWPQVADLDQQLVPGSGWVLARPNVEDLCAQFKAACSAEDRVSRKEATSRLVQALLAHEARVKE